MANRIFNSHCIFVDLEGKKEKIKRKENKGGCAFKNCEFVDTISDFTYVNLSFLLNTYKFF